MDDAHQVIETYIVNLEDPQDIIIDNGAHVIVERIYENSVERTLLEETQRVEFILAKVEGLTTFTILSITFSE